MQTDLDMLKKLRAARARAHLTDLHLDVLAFLLKSGKPRFLPRPRRGSRSPSAIKTPGWASIDEIHSSLEAKIKRRHGKAAIDQPYLAGFQWMVKKMIPIARQNLLSDAKLTSSLKGIRGVPIKDSQNAELVLMGLFTNEEIEKEAKRLARNRLVPRSVRLLVRLGLVNPHEKEYSAGQSLFKDLRKDQQALATHYSLDPLHAQTVRQFVRETGHYRKK
ncbi:MAG: hypothetical protein AABX01_03705 [Candidatus Micrarchaeota archaeon]